MTFYLRRLMYTYLQKVIRKKIRKIYSFLDSLKATDEKSRIRIRSKRYRSADPDPCQNVTDPQHCLGQIFKGYG
jgi:hypothetical protein